MKSIIEKINSKAKSINALSKSKNDWQTFANKEKIDKQLEQNRKDGYINKQNFLIKTKINQKSNFRTQFK